MTFLLEVLALSVCVLHAHAESSSDVCVESVNIESGTVVYYSDVNQDTFSEDITDFCDQIGAETMMILLTVTVPSSENGNESRIFQVAKTYLLYYMSPELVDVLSINSLSLVERTQQMVVNVRTFTTCANKSWESLLSDAFALEKEGEFVKLLQANNQTYYNAVVNSGLLVFMSLGLMSLFAVFVVFLPVLGTTTAFLLPILRLTTTSANRAEQQQIDHRAKVLSQMLAAMNSLNVVIYALYLAYLTLCMASYYINLDGTSGIFSEQYTISPFTSNALFLVLTVCSSFLGGMCFRKNRDGCSCWTRITIACTIALATAVLYHSEFLLLVLVEDFTTAFTSLVIKATTLFCMYTLFPAALQQCRITRSTKQFCNLWFILSLMTVVPFLYTITLVGARDLFNAGYVYTATKYWLVVVMLMTSLTWTFCLFMAFSAFKQRVPTGVRAENGNQDKTRDDPEKSLVTVSTVPGRFVTRLFVAPIAMAYLKKSRGPCLV